MCGILALVGLESPGHLDRLKAGLSAMTSRGPDGEGWAISACGTVAMGHRRLAVMDPATGGQPLHNEDATVMAVVNGEFYGFEAIRSSLEQRGHRFRTRTDSEILLHLYEEEGEAALVQLRGEFAFVLWDERRKTLLAGRDRFGIKPLLYGLHEGILHIGSNAKGIFEAGFPRAWDHRSFYQAMCMQYPLPGRSLFQGLSVLPPGHLLRRKRESLELVQYWDMDYPLDPAPLEGDPVQAFREHLTEAVRVRLRSDVPVAFQLSGGIDSSAVAALAARELGSPVPCFTVGFEGQGYDERILAAEVTTAIGGKHHIVALGPRDLADGFGEAVYAGEGLCINAHLVGKHRLSRAIQEAGYKVVLTGEGADEVLLGYAHLRQDLDGDPQGLARTNTASVGLMLPSGDQLSTQAVQRALGFVPTWLAAKASMGHRMHGVLSEDWRQSWSQEDPFAELMEGTDAGQVHGRPRPVQSTYLWSKLALEGYILRTLGDGMEMAHGVEGRLPFLDGKLFDWIRKAPLDLKIHQGTEKWVLREAMRGILPEPVRTREKHPFLAPPQFSPGSPFTELLGDLLEHPALANLPFFNRAALCRMLSSDGEDRRGLDPVLFLATSACLLHLSLGLSEGA